MKTLLIGLVALLYLHARTPQIVTVRPTARQSETFLKRMQTKRMTMKDLLAHLFAVDGFDGKIPKNAVEAAFYQRYTHAQLPFIWNEAHVIKKSHYYLLLIDRLDKPALAVTVDRDGSVHALLALRDHFGNNEYSRQRRFRQTKDGFIVTDEAYETEWIVFPTQGKRVLNYRQRYCIGIDENGNFYRMLTSPIQK